MLAQRRGGGDVHAARGVRLGLAFEQPRDFAELAADLVDHFEGRVADGGHGDRGDQEGNRAADEHADQHVGDPTVPGRSPGCCLHGLDEGGDDGQRRQRRRADGEALADRRRGVADLVEAVGDLAASPAHAGHLGDAAGVVRDRAVGVDGHGDADGGEHAHGGDADTVQARPATWIR
jgi:hypothetical protein